MHRIAVYPGTFDPITNGHTDLVQRAARLFDRVVLAIAHNPDKAPLFTIEERVALGRAVTEDIGNVQVEDFSGLLIDFARRCEATAVLRGLRAVSDFEYEFQLASMNRRLDKNIETVFLTPAENHTFVSASLVKEIAQYSGDVSQFVHPLVYEALRRKFHQPPWH